mgnify:CR=1 FL=1
MDEKPTMSELLEYRRWREEQLDNAKRRLHHFDDGMSAFEKAMLLTCTVFLAAALLLLFTGILVSCLHNIGVI